MEQLVKLDVPELKLLDKDKSEQIKKTFEPMAEMLAEFENRYGELIKKSGEGIDSELTKKAKNLRLEISKVRIATSKAKDKAKEYLKLEDKAIMGVHNILVWAVKEKEDKLKEIEDYFEIQERKRKDKLQQERMDKLREYLEVGEERLLWDLEEDEFEALLQMKKKAHYEKLEAIKRAEEERIAKEKAEAEERERIRKENERLKKEAEEQRAKIEAERKAQAEKERKEREIYEAKIKAEREEKERVERELQAKIEAEKKALAEIEEARQLELSKNDKEKIEKLILELEQIKSFDYKFKSKKYQKVHSETCNLIQKIIDYIKSKTF